MCIMCIDIMEVCAIVILQCLILSILYVSSLYIWSWKYQYERDHPSTIKRRFISVTIIAITSPIYLYFCIDSKYLDKYTIWQLLGFRIQGIWLASTYPLLLTVILFLGPIAFQIANGTCAMYIDKSYWRHNLSDLIWLRNHIVAPLSEELTYRACMVPLLLQCFPHLLTMFICPILFGTAHLNHLMENLKAGRELGSSLIFAAFQFLYTTIFGAYSTFLFLRTGHFITPVVAHMFCNHMGFPDLEPLHYSGIKRIIFIFFFFLGLIMWCVLLMPITEPSLYYNSIYWTQNYSSIKFS